MTTEQLTQAYELQKEKENTKRYAQYLRRDITTRASDFTALPTAGIEANLIALIDVWEHQRSEQIETDFANL